MEHIVFVGLGLASTLAMPINIKSSGINARYVTCLLPNEHPDQFRLMRDVEKRFNIKIEDIGTGKTPIQIFKEQMFLGNSLHDNCSRVLKREQSLKFMKENYPNGANVYIGIGAHEIDREMSIRRNWAKSGYDVHMPLIDRPKLTRKALMDLCRALFGYVPELYELDFEHGNCHGACIKSGKKQWAKVFKFFPDVYNEWEEAEEYIRRHTRKDVSILTEMIKGLKRRLTLREWRVRLQSGEVFQGIGIESETGCVFCDSL